jgi:hypothetical protein
MIPNTRQQLLQSLASISALAPEMRFGQLLATLGFLAEDRSNHRVWDIEDGELLEILERHRAELSQRLSNPA